MLFKTSTDVIWHAATLEGIATIFIVEAWLAGHGLVCFLVLDRGAVIDFDLEQFH